MALKNTKDHWAFLEEIEAPMWVDLNLEAKHNGQDVDDNWFHRSHTIHQCSSHELKSFVSLLSQEGVTSELDILGASSPTLPASVSRSRGKDYQSKNSRGNNCGVSLKKPHVVKVLSGKSSGVDPGSVNEIKAKMGFVDSKGTSRWKQSLVSEITRNVQGNYAKPSCHNSGTTASHLSKKSCSSSNTSSIVTSESIKKQELNSHEESSRAFGQTRRHLPAVRINLRRGQVTRQASGVEIKADRQGSSDRRSCSSKSSVSSSSYTSNISLIKKEEQTPDSRNVERITGAGKDRVIGFNMRNAFKVQMKKGTPISRAGVLTNGLKINYPEAAKSKAPKPLLSQSVNHLHSFTGATQSSEKVKMSRFNRVGAGKENVIGRTSVSKNYTGKSKAASGTDVDGKGPKLYAPWKGGRRGLGVAKQGKNGNRKDEKNVTSAIQRPHFR